MKHMDRAGFAERLKTAAEARKTLLAGFTPKPTITDPQISERHAMRAAALDQVRRERTEAKAAKKQAAADAAALAKQAEEAAAASELDLKRSERKTRKALTKAEAKAKRDARYAARKARQ